MLPITEDEAIMTKIEVHESGPYTIGLSQKDSRCFKETSNYNYGSCRVLIAHKQQHGEVRYLKGTRGYGERDVYIECEHLEKGTYFVMIQMLYDHYIVDEFK